MRLKKSASAHWEGGLKTGKGNISVESNTLKKTKYSYGTRFESRAGTNPEELLAAAHASCYTMAVGAALENEGFEATSLDTVATIKLEGLEITQAHLSIKGRVPDISEKKFAEIAKAAEKTCIMSKALRIPISSDATLVH